MLPVGAVQVADDLPGLLQLQGEEVLRAQALLQLLPAVLISEAGTGFEFGVFLLRQELVQVVVVRLPEGP